MNFTNSQSKPAAIAQYAVTHSFSTASKCLLIGLLSLLSVTSHAETNGNEADAGDIANYVKLVAKGASSVNIGDTKTIIWKLSTRKKNSVIALEITSDDGIRIEKGYSNYNLPLDENRVYEVPVKITATGAGTQNIYFNISDVSKTEAEYVGRISMTVTVKTAG